MKDKKLEQAYDNVQGIKEAIKQYVYLLDNPDMRVAALSMGYAGAKDVTTGCDECDYNNKMAVEEVAFNYVGIFKDLALVYEVSELKVATTGGISWALHNLAKNISTRDDRIVACRQIDLYPSVLSPHEYGAGRLSMQDLYVAKEVYNSLTDIGLGIEELREKKGE